MFKFSHFIVNIFNRYRKEKNFNNIFIDKYTYGQPLILDWTHKYNLYIGKFCSIAGGVQIILDGNHRLDWISTFAFHVIDGVQEKEGHPIGKANMKIGNDVWIGRDAIILPGVSIGDGAVVGAGAIVTKNVDAYSIVAGNPARHIKYRFTSKQIEKLKSIKWWNWDIEKIKKNVNLLRSENIDLFINKVYLNEL